MEIIPSDPEIKTIVRLVLENWKDMDAAQKSVFATVVEFYMAPPMVTMKPGAYIPWTPGWGRDSK